MFSILFHKTYDFRGNCYAMLGVPYYFKQLIYRISTAAS
jgi:hypothetical protein